MKVECELQDATVVILGGKDAAGALAKVLLEREAESRSRQRRASLARRVEAASDETLAQIEGLLPAAPVQPVEAVDDPRGPRGMGRGRDR